MTVRSQYFEYGHALRDSRRPSDVLSDGTKPQPLNRPGSGCKLHLQWLDHQELPQGGCARAIECVPPNTAGGQDERRCKPTPPGFPQPAGWLGFNASGAPPNTATGLSRHGREGARETRGEGHGRRQVRVALGSEQAAASIFFLVE